MLELRVYNVGDGDAILLRERRGGRPDYTVLVDTGRPFVELYAGSRRRDVLTHLAADGVDHLDLMVLTHLHIDHMGCAERILQHLPVARMLVDYLPPEGAGRVEVPADTPVKASADLKIILNIYQDLLREAVRRGTAVLRPRDRSGEDPASGLMLTDCLRLRLYPAPEEELAGQQAVFDALYRGRPVSDDEVYRAAKARNSLGLALVFEYAGVRIGLGADVYAWDLVRRGLGPCRILKMPHHGDEKSASPELLEQIRPEWAVISCQIDPPEKKHRPAAPTLELLAASVPHVYCTENAAFPGFPAASYRAVGLDVTEEGGIIPRIG